MLSKRGIKALKNIVPGNDVGTSVNQMKNNLVDFNPIAYHGGSLIPKNLMKKISSVGKEAIKIGAPIAKKFAKEAIMKYALPALEDAIEVAPEAALIAAGRKRVIKKKAAPPSIKGGAAIPATLSRWVKHVKEYQAKHNCSYGDALKLSSSSYKKEKK